MHNKYLDYIYWGKIKISLLLNNTPVLYLGDHNTHTDRQQSYLYYFSISIYLIRHGTSKISIL